MTYHKDPALNSYMIQPHLTGGPASYYDLPAGAITLNDLIEYKGCTSWLGDTFHLGNLMKALYRWGNKEGTTKSYDSRKIMYTGARLLMRYSGVSALRRYLQELLDDPQFKDDV